MREKAIYILGAAAAILLTRNLYEILLGLPDEVMQGAIYRIIFFHVPAAWTFMLGSFVSMVASVMYLRRKSGHYDSLAASVTEVALVFGVVNLVTGMIWARIIWGIWWAWDARLTFMLVACLMSASYMMLRNAIDEATLRARLSAVLSILTFPAVVVTWKSIIWWRTQHPGPVLSIRGANDKMDPAMQSVLYFNLLALLLFATALVLIRMRQEKMRREIDGMRQEIHAI